MDQVQSLQQYFLCHDIDTSLFVKDTLRRCVDTKRQGVSIITTLIQWHRVIIFHLRATQTPFFWDTGSSGKEERSNRDERRANWPSNPRKSRWDLTFIRGMALERLTRVCEWTLYHLTCDKHLESTRMATKSNEQAWWVCERHESGVWRSERWEVQTEIKVHKKDRGLVKVAGRGVFCLVLIDSTSGEHALPPSTSLSSKEIYMVVFVVSETVGKWDTLHTCPAGIQRRVYN